MRNHIDYPGFLYAFFKELFISIQPYCWMVWFLGGIIFMLSYLYVTRKNTNKVFYFVFVFLGLLFFRLPSFMQYSYNPDESEFLSSINLLSNNIQYWKITDTHTTGPLGTIPFVLLSYVGLKWNYFSFRLINVCFIQFPSLVLMYYTFKYFFDNKQTQIILFPVVLFFTFLSTNELIMYSSEQIPNLLLILSIFCLIKYNYNNTKKITLVFGAFVLGLIPLAKFQYLFLAGFIFALYLYALLSKKMYKQVCSIILVLIFPTIIAILITIRNHSFQDACISYIKMNFVIAKEGLGYNVPFPESLLNVLYLLQINLEFKVLFFALFVLFGYHILFNKDKISLSARSSIIIFLFFMLAYFTVIKTGNLFYHYLFIFICPVVVIYGYLYYENQRNRFFSKLYYMIFFLLFIYANYQNKYFIDDIYRKIDDTYLPVSKLINSIDKSNNKMAVWGWNTRLFVETSSIQATRDPHIFNQVYKSRYSEYFFKRYLSDIKESKPAIFVDAVPGFYFKDLKYRHENYPDINSYITEYYEKVATADSVRIYRLRK